MTHNELVEMLEEASLPLAYDHFAEGESPDPPFICFLFPYTDNFAADGQVYLKDPNAEARLEKVLDRNGIFYDKSEVWIESEKLYEVLYSFERKVSDGEQEE